MRLTLALVITGAFGGLRPVIGAGLTGRGFCRAAASHRVLTVLCQSYEEFEETAVQFEVEYMTYDQIQGSIGMGGSICIRPQLATVGHLDACCMSAKSCQQTPNMGFFYRKILSNTTTKLRMVLITSFFENPILVVVELRRTKACFCRVI